ncbi:hypothetical protein EDD15DRAFT_2160530 [Pisolithus albus]|nr:hypothetical protein EDD15DRAFT_2160530 [Pisolithus albus]
MAFHYVQSPDLHGQYHNLLKAYFHLEESSNFVNGKGPTHTFSSKLCPEVIHWWISRARTGCPPIQDVHKFSTTFWTWWCELQPAWRKTLMPETAKFVPALRTVAGEWKELDKPGLNGFLSVITALKWWGAEIDIGDAQSTLWNVAVSDVSWVMEQLIESCSINDDDSPK